MFTFGTADLGSFDPRGVRKKNSVVGVGISKRFFDDEDEECAEPVHGNNSSTVALEELQDEVEDGISGPCVVSDIDGMNAQKYFRLAMSDQKMPATETSRVARYKQKVKSGQEVHTNVGLVSNEPSCDDVIHSYDCPMVVLVKNVSGVSLAIITPTGFEYKGQKDSSLPKSYLASHETIVKGFLVVPSITSDTVSWKVKSSSVYHNEFKGILSSPINPEINLVNGHLEYSFLLSIMKEVFKCMCAKYFQLVDESDSSSCVVLPEWICGSHLPYYGPDRTVSFLETVEDVDLLPSSKSSKVETRHQGKYYICQVPGCAARVKIKNARNHTAYHIQHDSKIVDRVGMPVSDMCGFCCSNKAIQFRGGGGGGYAGSDFALSIPECQAWVRKPIGKKTVKLYGYCCVIGRVDTGYKTAMKSTKSNPSTNVPIVCPHCPKVPMPTCIWKHGMRQHMIETHPEIQLGENEYTTSSIEKSALPLFALGIKNYPDRSTGALARNSKKRSPLDWPLAYLGPIGTYPGFERSFGGTPEHNPHLQMQNLRGNGNCGVYFAQVGLAHHGVELVPKSVCDFRKDLRTYIEDNKDQLLFSGEYYSKFCEDGYQPSDDGAIPLDRIYKLGVDFDKGCGSAQHFDSRALYFVCRKYGVSFALFHESSIHDQVFYYNESTEECEVRCTGEFKFVGDDADNSKWIIGIKTTPNQKYGPCHYVWMAPKEEAEFDEDKDKEDDDEVIGDEEGVEDEDHSTVDGLLEDSQELDIDFETDEGQELLTGFVVTQTSDDAQLTLTTNSQDSTVAGDDEDALGTIMEAV